MIAPLRACVGEEVAMGWMRALVLLVGAWVLLVGSDCGNPSSDSTCDELYGSIASYQLCEQKASSCVFYRSDKQEPEISCAVICVSAGAICLNAYNQGETDVCEVGDELMCDAPPCEETSCQVPAADAVCECGNPSNGGTGGTGGSRTLADRCAQSDEFYCGNGYFCRDEFNDGAGWSVSADIFEQLYGQSEEECLSSSRPCTTEEAYCEDRGFAGTYNAANHEACISGQDPEIWTQSCPVDDFGFPVFPPECDQICVSGGLGDSCESTDDCDPNASDLGVFCCLENAATCGNNLGECVEDCSQYSSGGEVGMMQDALCQDNNECGAGLFCCLAPDAPGNCDFTQDQSCTCRNNP
jgi:hypothetical protein